MEMERSNKFDWTCLLIGVLFLFVALVAFRNPAANLAAITIVFALAALFKGLLLIRYRGESLMRLIVGVLDVAIGVVFLINLGFSMAIMPYIFAFWFIMTSIDALVYSWPLRLLNRGLYIFTLVLNVLCVLLGFFMAANPVSSILTMSFLAGFYFMSAGIVSILLAFGRPRA
ncbi:HdeD family acid-resistance protein [Desulfovibrio legallii]|uniref:Uncharacterized membrane protein HdeD, DUF308 family n=1 Tax=Desulfovibrio legallii TaxID=571438 RepID=A0A1G7M725_9BACT|nr:DUF308 domain-containing protein [Desulfovibrio legallii]SDF57434.1 Uncharacterized membrane protein HdeD, DUF308 family [Desulfovibrio legallii]